jgi:Initiator Replication protein
MNKKKHKPPAPTGNPWKPNEQDPATIPIPLPVIIVKIEGPYTERDRKLWVFLLHAVWDELGEKPIHVLPVFKINQVFRECGGRHESTWIWECAKRLTETTAQWIRTEDDTRYKGIASLFQAEITDEAKERGKLRFAFPALLIPIIKDPRRFARLRVHFLIGLSGKYAVTLYELLESVANMKDPILDVPIDTLRIWLKVPECKLNTWDNFNRRALLPAIEQINSNPLGAGFTVDLQTIKKGRAVHRVRFHVKKVDQRLAIEKALQDSISPTMTCQRVESTGPLFNPVRLSTTDYEKAAASAPGWDIYQYESEWQEWIAKKGNPEKPGPAFIAFCRKKYQREGRRK